VIARLFAITLNTFREAVRDRVLYNLILFVLLLVACAPLFGQISIGLERLILVNVGLSSISLFGVIIAIFIGIGLVAKEIEKKTLYTILSRPVRRWEFIVGKYFGLLLTLVVNTALMTVGFFVALLITAHSLKPGDARLLVAIYFIVLQFMIMVALTLLFSSFSNFCRRPEELCRHLARCGPMARHGCGLRGAELRLAERDLAGGPRPACKRQPGRLQHSLRDALFGCGHGGRGADL
jgi:hypothetical protein